MGYFRRKLVCLLMAALLLGLTACSGQQAEQTESVKESSAQAETEKEETVTETEGTEAVKETLQEEQESPAETESTEAKVQTQEASRKNALLHVQLESRMTGSMDKESYVCKAKINYPSLTLEAEDAADYPALQQALEAFNDETESSFQASLQDMEKNFAEITESNPEMAESLELCNELTINVVRADSIALSLAGLRYAYYGGAHPDHFVVCNNFDADSGKLLQLSDVITDMDAFVQLVDAKLQEKYWDIYPTFFQTPQEAMSAIDTEEAGVVWSLGYEGITLYFNPYCLGSYAMGQQVIYLSFDEISNLVAPYYAIGRSDFVIPINSELPLYVDVNGNGETEEISVSGEYPEGEEYAYNVIVSCGNRSCDPKTYAFSQEAYLVKSDSQYYVWLFASAENDYVLFSCIDLKTMACDTEKQSNLFLPTLEGDWEDTETGYVTWGKKNVFTDPEQVDLGSRISFLSTMTGMKTYHAGADGWPESEETLYRFEGTMALRTKTEVNAALVNEEGEVIGEAVIPSGVILSFVRGDGESFADFQEVSEETAEISAYSDSIMISLKEKTEMDLTKPIYRIYEDKSSWPYTVDGKEESNCFDGIMYAG